MGHLPDRPAGLRMVVFQWVHSPAALAVGFAGVAGAAEVKKDTAKAPALSAKAMTDKDMDKVTAGAYVYVGVNGNYQTVGGGGQSGHRNANNGYENSNYRGACFGGGCAP